jgi:hypothetical protein
MMVRFHIRSWAKHHQITQVIAIRSANTPQVSPNEGKLPSLSLDGHGASRLRWRWSIQMTTSVSSPSIEQGIGLAVILNRQCCKPFQCWIWLEGHRFTDALVRVRSQPGQARSK